MTDNKERIQHANTAIQDVYEKISDENLVGLISKEDILTREFDNMFIFEDFFDEYLEENKEDPDCKKILIANIIDTIEANFGDITIEELIYAVTSEDSIEIYKEQEASKIDLDVNKRIFNTDYEENFDIEYKNQSILDFKDLNSDKADIELNKIAKQNKNKDIVITVKLKRKK